MACAASICFSAYLYIPCSRLLGTKKRGSRRNLSCPSAYSCNLTLKCHILPLLLHHKAKKFGVASVDATPINTIVFFHSYYITSRNPFDRYLTLTYHTLPLLPALLLPAPLSPAHAFSALLSTTGQDGVYSLPSNSPPISIGSPTSITVSPLSRLASIQPSARM